MDEHWRAFGSEISLFDRSDPGRLPGLNGNWVISPLESRWCGGGFCIINQSDK